MYSTADERVFYLLDEPITDHNKCNNYLHLLIICLHFFISLGLVPRFAASSIAKKQMSCLGVVLVVCCTGRLPLYVRRTIIFFNASYTTCHIDMIQFVKLSKTDIFINHIVWCTVTNISFLFLDTYVVHLRDIFVIFVAFCYTLYVAFTMQVHVPKC